MGYNWIDGLKVGGSLGGEKLWYRVDQPEDIRYTSAYVRCHKGTIASLCRGSPRCVCSVPCCLTSVSNVLTSAGARGEHGERRGAEERCPQVRTGVASHSASCLVTAARRPALVRCATSASGTTRFQAGRPATRRSTLSPPLLPYQPAHPHAAGSPTTPPAPRRRTGTAPSSSSTSRSAPPWRRCPAAQAWRAPRPLRRCGTRRGPARRTPRVSDSGNRTKPSGTGCMYGEDAAGDECI